MPCPNKNLPQWQSLVDALGSEAKALAAFTLNKYDIPSVAEARVLLDNMSSGTLVPVRAEVKQRKLDRVDEQVKTLDALVKKMKDGAQKATVQKLIDNLQQYRDVVENDEVTVSVSNLVAGGEIEDLDKYRNYALFGTFLHNVVETLQKETLGTDKSLLSVFSREKLEKLYKEYGDKFDITGLVSKDNIQNMEELYNMTADLLGVLQNYVSMGYSVLPEVSVMSTDRFGRRIVGRLDILAVNKKGEVAILDIKTKKMKAAAAADSLEKSWPVSSSAYTDAEFIGGVRNAYDNWDIQLGIYSRMLQQIGIPTAEKRILTALYYGRYASATGKQFDEDGNDTFQYEYYKSGSYISSEHSKETNDEYLRYRELMRKTRKVIPVAGEQSEAKEIRNDNNLFNLPEEEAAKIMEKIREITERELLTAQTKLKEIRKKQVDSELEDYYKERVATLNKIKDVMGKDIWEDAYKVGLVIRNLEVDIDNLVRTVEKIRVMTPEGDFLERAKELERLNRTAVGYSWVTNELKTLLLDANIPENAKAIQGINSIENNIGLVKGVYNQLGFSFTMEVLKGSLSDRQVERLNEDRRQALQDKVNMLKEKRDRLKAGGKESGLWYRLSNPVSNVINSALRQEVNPRSELEKLDLEITRLELEMQGVKLDEKSLKEYINGILDPKSPIYIGQGTSYWTQFIAGASSSDWLLSSYANQLKISLANGTSEFVNFVEREGLQQELDNFRGGETDMTRLNERVSEVRKMIEYDEDGNESMREVRSFINPLSEEYVNVFERHRRNIRNLSEAIRNETDLDKLDELKVEKRKAIKDHLEWRLQNTQMRYNQEVYELDKLLPEEYKEERDALYEEKSMLENAAGFNKAEELDESIVYRIAEIEVELNKLRKKYADMKEGGYAQYLALQEKYFDYETNWDYFRRLENQKILELTDANGNLDKESFRKWKDANTVRRPKQEWYDLVSEKWEEIFQILGKQDPTIASLKESYREILNQYKRKGVIDSRFMTQEDNDTLAEIDEIINAYKSATGSRLDDQDRQVLNDLFQDLESLQTRVENPFYMQEFSQRVEELEQAWTNYQGAAGDTKDMLMEQFLLKEMDFKTWYDNNHINQYTSKLLSNEGLNPLPKKFNMSTVPASEDMFEEVPDYKFTRRSMKPEAYNIEYQEDVNGVPLPKGVILDDFNPAIFSGDSPWLNAKYRELRKDARAMAFYESFVSRFLNMQKNTTGNMLAYAFPGYEEQSLDNYKNNGVLNGVRNRINMIREKNFTVGGAYDYTMNGFGSGIEDRIQFGNNKPLPIEQQTTDGIGAVIRWYEQAHVNKSMAAVQATSKSMIAFMENQFEKLSNSYFEGKEQRMVDFRRVIDQMKFEYDKFVKGEWKKDEGLAGRVGDMVLSGIGITRLGLDLPNQVGNMISGNVQAFLGSVKSGLYTSKNYLWAKGKIEGRDGLVGALIRDYGKVGNKSFMTKMLLYFNPIQESLDHYYNRTRTTGQRLAQGLADGNFLFYLQDKGELEISSTIWLAIMDNMKVKLVKERNADGSVKEYQKDENGNIKTVNSFDAYIQNAQGEIVIREDVEWSKKDEDAVKKMVWSEIRRTQGKYADWDRSKIEAGFTGRLLLYYRKYLEPAIRNRFGRRETNYEAGEVAVGFYRGLIDALRIYGPGSLFKSIFGIKGTGVSDFYRRKSLMAVREVATGALMYILGRMILAALPDDDDEELTVSRIILYNMVAVFAKVDQETRSLMPVPIIGGIGDYMENLGSFTNAARDVTKSITMMENMIYLGMAQFTDPDTEWGQLVEKRAYYQRKTGMFEEGEAKFKKNLMELSGYMNIYELFSPEVRVQNYLTRR